MASPRDILKGFVHSHLSSVEQWVKAVIYKNIKSAYEAKKRMEKNSSAWKPRYVGSVQLNGTGAKTHLFCNGWRPEHMEHEYWVTEHIIPFWRRGFQVWRGKLVAKRLIEKYEIGGVEPDALAEGSIPVFVEVDMGTETEAVLEEKFRKYSRLPFSPVSVWYAPEDRMPALVERLPDNAVWSVFDSGVVNTKAGLSVTIEDFITWVNADA